MYAPDTDGTTGEPCDRLVIATGARAAVPPISGTWQPRAFTLRTLAGMRRIKAYRARQTVECAAIIGTGLIGVEAANNLKGVGVRVTLLEKCPQGTPGLDRDRASHVRAHRGANGVSVLTGVAAEALPLPCPHPARLRRVGGSALSDSFAEAGGESPPTVAMRINKEAILPAV